MTTLREAYSVQAKEPYASAEDYGKYIVNKDSVPWTELVPGANTHLIWGDKAMISFMAHIRGEAKAVLNPCYYPEDDLKRQN